MKLESERPNIQADLEAGKRLQKEKNAPVFVAQQVSELDKKWKDTNEKAKAKHEKLKVKQSLLHLDCKAQQSVHASMTYNICAKIDCLVHEFLNRQLIIGGLCSGSK